ncbi:hypothetical protein E0K89_008865 [Aquicoccus sp. SCR17]|nr:hypothetical protein [Carideicomes alvinocaridis]
MRMKTFATSLILAVSVAAGSVSAKTPLREVREIDDNMLWVALAIEISDKCGQISPRMIKGYAFLASLKLKAQNMGYTSDEIEAYVESKAEKQRMRQRGESYVKARGFDPKKKEDLCRLGRQEIDKGSRIGALLKAK